MDSLVYVPTFAFNRTIEELKLTGEDSMDQRQHAAFNRTIEELKRIFESAISNFFFF